MPDLFDNFVHLGQDGGWSSAYFLNFVLGVFNVLDSLCCLVCIHNFETHCSFLSALYII